MVLEEVVCRIPAFGYKRIAIRSRQTKYMYLKIIINLSPFLLLCVCAQLLQNVSTSCQPSLTLFSSLSFGGKVYYCFWRHEQSQKCLVAAPNRTACVDFSCRS